MILVIIVLWSVPSLRDTLRTIQSVMTLVIWIIGLWWIWYHAMMMCVCVDESCHDDVCVWMSHVITQYGTRNTISDGTGHCIIGLWSIWYDAMMMCVCGWAMSWWYMCVDESCHDDMSVWLSHVITQYGTRNTISDGTGDDWINHTHIDDDEYHHHTIYSQYNVLWAHTHPRWMPDGQTERQRGRETDRETERQRDRETDRQTERQRDRETERQRDRQIDR